MAMDVWLFPCLMMDILMSAQKHWTSLETEGMRFLYGIDITSGFTRKTAPVGIMELTNMLQRNTLSTMVPTIGVNMHMLNGWTKEVGYDAD